MKKLSYCIIMLAGILLSCGNEPDEVLLEQALQFAGVNRPELEKVIAHYADDSLKLEAAKFLIRNMPGHYSYEDTSVVIRYSQAVDSLLTAMRDSAHHVTRDSINACARRMGIDRQKKVQDIHIIKADYLIRNIDDAFNTWRGLWGQHLDFDRFCEMILPYKVEELQLLDDWRFRLKDFYSRSLRELEWCDAYRNSTLEAARMLTRNLGDYMRPNYEGAVAYPVMKFEVNAKVPFGTCDYYAPIANAIFRSHGIPVVHDFTPHWACRRLGHSWNMMVAENGHNQTFNGVSSSPGDGHNLAEKMAKVYRHTYAANPSLVHLNKYEPFVPTIFRNIFLKDVTAEYLGTVDVSVPVRSVPRGSGYAYLAIYGDNEWVPVAFGVIRKGHAFFKDLGKNVLYVPFCYQADGTRTAVGNPFIVQPDGKKKDLAPNGEGTLTLKRKYPTLEYVYHWLHRLDSCEFQASNDADFQSYHTIHRIRDCHATGYEVQIADSIPPCRYWRFMSSNEDTHGNVSELYFFDEGGKALRGKMIGTKGSWHDLEGYALDKAFDGDILTFFDAPDGVMAWVGMDFGQPVRVGRLFYYARGDGNAVEPYDRYELLYWDDGKWNSAGKKTPKKPYISFSKVPMGSVYLLRDLTKGHDERVFTYENGQQVWW